jgi:competence ComEA-like helix-hairpin-helix protein
VVLKPPLTDLNTADSAALVAVSGIGALTAQRIIEYRARLGGFADAAQLAEIRGMTEQNYERIIQQIFVDPAEIQKIDINFAPAKSLATHPYIRAEALRKLLKQRQLKGGWRTAGELETEHIFSREELEKLGPYLLFN